MKQLVADMVTLAFNTIGDLKDTAVYRRKIPSTYDPATDSMTNPTTLTSILGVFARFKANEINSSVITLTDAKFLFPAVAITFEPKTHDEIVLKGKTWNVHSVLSVPGDSLYKLHLREK
jgi:hypothetical protein